MSRFEAVVGLLHDCETEALTIPEQAAAPLPTEPETFPAGPIDAGEELVEVEGPRLSSLPVYSLAGWKSAEPRVVLRAGVVERLARAAHSLSEGLGLCVLDGWRPLALQAELHAVAYAGGDLPEGYVSVPDSDPATPPPHLTGGTADLTLTLRGRPLALGTAFDAFTPLARADAFEAVPGKVRDARRLLRAAMAEAGFVGLEMEWWHFEWGTRRWAAATGSVVQLGPAAIARRNQNV